jgi:predicted lipoprotein with Yx(FWY)xxD motif
MGTTRSIVPALVVTFALLATGPAWSDDVPAPFKQAKSAQLGTILTGPSGMTVYTFTADKGDGKSHCSGACARRWPPVTAAAGAPAPRAPLSLITREDGARQYAWKGKPLYYYAEDRKPGDATGHEVGKAWFVVNP